MRRGDHRSSRGITEGLVALGLTCAAVGAQGLGPSIDLQPTLHSGGHTELLADGPDGTVLRHEWGTVDEPTDAVVLVACPATQHPNLEVRRWTLRDPQSGEERTHSVEAGEVPLALERLRPARIQGVGQIRHTRVASVRLIPSRVTLENRQWVITGLEVALPFDGGTVSEASGEAVVDPFAEALITSLVINPDGVSRWADPNPPLPREINLEVWRPDPVPGRWVKIEVEDPGPVRVDLRELVSAGVPRDAVDLQRIEVYHHGGVTPLWIDPRGDGFIFVAPDHLEPHSARTAFWLDLAGHASPERMVVISAEPPSPEQDRCHPWVEEIVEEDHPDVETAVIEPHPRALARPKQDPAARRAAWIWETLASDEPVTVGLPRPPGPPGTLTASGEVALNLIVEHGARGGPGEIDLVTSDGATALLRLARDARFRSRSSVRLPAESLFAGDLTLVPRGLRAPAARPTNRGSSAGKIHLDSVVLHRPVASLRGSSVRRPITLVPPPEADDSPATIRLPASAVAFNVAADPPFEIRPSASRVLIMRGREWRAVVAQPEAFPGPARIKLWEPVDLRSPEHRADMVIVTDAELKSAAERLAEHHRAEGLATEVVLTEAIYDCHGEGVASPHAIRAFLADAFRRWAPPAPLYVALLGDCTRDDHDVYPDTVRNLVPSFSDPKPSANAVYWEASDLRHVQIAGQDLLADMAIGRLSAQDLKGAMTLVEKAIAYAADPPPGPWKARIGFIADNDRIGAVSFDEMCENLREQTMSASLVTERVYLRELALVDNLLLPAEVIVDPLYEKVSREATTRIRDLFNAGHLISTYFGHGGPNIWADERIWFGCESPRSDNLRLNEERRLPFLINMTCSSGAIDFPTERLGVCISEDFMRSRGGAIACFVPTGEGLPSQHRQLTRWLLRAVFEQGLRRLGDITTEAGWRHVLEDRGSDLPEHFVLLGDPALALALPDAVTHRAGPPPLRAGVDRTVTFDATPTVFDHGAGVAWLNSPDGVPVVTREVLWKPGEALGELRFEIPPDPVVGRWGMGALWWDESGRRDELIHTEFLVERPRLVLDRLGLPEGGRPVSAGQVASVEVGVRCDSAIGTEPFTLALVDLAHPAPREPLATVDLRLGPHESRAVTLEWTAEAGLYQLLVEAGGIEELWTDESYLRLSEPMALAVVDPGASAELVTTAAHVRTALRANGLTQAERLTVTVGNIGVGPTGAGLLTVIPGATGAPLASPIDIPPLPSGRVVDVPVNLRGTGSLQVGATLALRIDWTDIGGGGAHRESRVEVTLDPPRPDPVVAADQWQLRPESPSEGETVFLDIVVENRGPAAAADVKLSLRDEEGRRLRNRADTPLVTLPCLRPGERWPVTLRWDPRDNAGDQTLHVWIEPSRIVNSAGGRRSSLAVPLHVRTGEDVQFTKAVHVVDRLTDPPGLTLFTQITNRGETEARDQVITWYRDQERTVRLGESDVPALPFDRYLDVEFDWIFSEEDLALLRQGVVFDPTCDLGVRASERRVLPPGEPPSP